MAFPRAEQAQRPEYALAPLIVREIEHGSSSHPAPRASTLATPRDALRHSQADASRNTETIERIAPPGALRLDDLDRLIADPADPAVYVRQSEVVLAGRRYTQFLYVWFHAGTRNRLYSQGLRMTLGPDGYPIVWEVFRPALPRATTERPHVVFVSESFEEAAERICGPPRNAEAFSAERTDHAGGTVVLDVLPDGPVPLGPYVYLRGTDLAVTALRCRCSPQRFDQVVRTFYYDLRPMEELLVYRAHLPPSLLSWIEGDEPGARSLDQQLCWPYPPAREKPLSSERP
ncbi:MAG: hypothetical protein D6788_06445 [Planctomycetota bacterium]|nr:MAG: hypothetical protein D6788_06445 [Planctomycetota bacterium]